MRESFVHFYSDADAEVSENFDRSQSQLIANDAWVDTSPPPPFPPPHIDKQSSVRKGFTSD